MEKGYIVNLVGAKFQEVDGGATYPKTFSTISYSNLLTQQVANRASKGWGKAQYIIVSRDDSECTVKDLLEYWGMLARNGQYLIVETPDMVWEMYDSEKRLLGGEDFIKKYFEKSVRSENLEDFVNTKQSYLSALRTKPFMLLAGISGTGKSRIVREFAFKCCPKELQDKDGTTPGNYCMVEVKPNWHDSTELLGFWSNLQEKYIFTKFVKFLVKAKMYPNVPFFVCLDEMNLAPVEQYFAEFLSVVETRKNVNGKIKSGVLVDKEYFKKFASIPNTKNVVTGEAAYNLKNDKDIYEST